MKVKIIKKSFLTEPLVSKKFGKIDIIGLDIKGNVFVRQHNSKYVSVK